MEEYSYIEKPKRLKSVVVINVIFAITVVTALVVVILFSTTFMTIAVVGNSMSPTLKNGDKLLLIKHGYKLNRGDIVVFQREDSNNVKRILGLEGDVIQFDLDNMTWIVNGEVYKEEYIEGSYSDNYFYMSKTEVKEAIFSKKGLVVPQGHMFVLGDNRNIQEGNVSIDSHVYGTLDTSSIMGKVIKIY